MHINFLRDVFRGHLNHEAFVWGESGYSYSWLVDQIAEYHRELDEVPVEARSVVMLYGDFSPYVMAAMLCLIERATVVVPVTRSSEDKAAEFARISQAEFKVRFGQCGQLDVTATAEKPDHELYERLAESAHPGLVLFSSGSTGEPKGIVHDLHWLMKKYRTARHCYRTLAFLAFDHIGGIDTAFYSLSNGSCLVLCADRSPDQVCEAIQRHQVEVLPVAPSFLKLLALSGAYRRYDMSSLKYVTYGAEMMPQSTLDKCGDMFPGVTIMQKYGTSEVGTLRSKSRGSRSLWVKIGGEGFETRVADGQLEIKAESSMLGYLNAPSPFTKDGWFMTGDRVDVDGEYIRFLGRDSDMINVGGQKVYPAEVESVIGTLENIDEVAVFGEENSLMGQIVCAQVRTVEEEDPKQVSRRIRAVCREKLASYKIPVKIDLTDATLTNSRFKVRRRGRGDPLRSEE